MRHVPRTQRVALDLLFERSNLDSKILIRYIDTKHRLADILTKVISHVTNGTIFFICWTSTISALLAALRNPAWQAAPKRWRRGCKNRREKKKLWQNRNPQRWTCLHMFRQVPHRQKSPIASKGPGILVASGKLESRMRRNSKSDAASSAQARLQDACWRVDGTQQWWNLSQQRKNQEMWIFPNLKPGVFKKTQWRWDPLLFKQLRFEERIPRSTEHRPTRAESSSGNRPKRYYLCPSLNRDLGPLRLLHAVSFKHHYATRGKQESPSSSLSTEWHAYGALFSSRRGIALVLFSAFISFNYFNGCKWRC